MRTPRTPLVWLRRTKKRGQRTMTIILSNLNRFTIFFTDSSLIACFADIIVSQGSVATYARRGGIIDVRLTANLPRNVPAKVSFKSVEI